MEILINDRQREESICTQSFVQNAMYCGSQLVRDSGGLRHVACNGLTRSTNCSISYEFSVNSTIKGRANLLV